ELWHVGGRAPVWTHRLDWPVTRAVFSHDGRLVGVIGNGPDALLLATSSGGLVHSFHHSDFVKSVAFSPNDAYLVPGRRNGIARVWDVHEGRAVADLKARTKDIVTVAFSPSGQMVATGSLDGTARTWRLDGKRIATFSGHGGGVNSVAFSPDSRY